MLNWQGKNCIGLVKAIEAAGITLYATPEGEVCSDPQVAQDIIDAFDLNAHLADVLVPKIKAKARDVILSRLPEWKQANMTARAVELVGAGQASGAEWDAMQALWAWVKAVREHSDALEAQALASPQTVDIEAGWPE